MSNLELKIDRLEAKLETYMQAQDKRFDSFVQEMRQQNQMRANEIRDLQKRQDEERRARDAERRAQEAERRARDAEMKEARRKHEEDMRAINKKIDEKFDKLSSQIQMMSLSTILGIGAIVWAIVSALK